MLTSALSRFASERSERSKKPGVMTGLVGSVVCQSTRFRNRADSPAGQDAGGLHIG
jgi:hypothetical protein